MFCAKIGKKNRPYIGSVANRYTSDFLEKEGDFLSYPIGLRVSCNSYNDN